MSSGNLLHESASISITSISSQTNERTGTRRRGNSGCDKYVLCFYGGGAIPSMSRGRM